MATTNAQLPAAASHFVDDKAAMRAALHAQHQQPMVGNPAAPAWGSYLYQNFLLPAFSPSEWIATPPGSIQPPPHAPAPGSNPDYFAWQQGPPPQPAKPESSASDAAGPQQQHVPTTGGPSAFYPQPYYPPPSIPTSLLQTASSSSSISPSVDVIDTQISISGTPSPHSLPAYFHSPPFGAGAGAGPIPPKQGVKRRASSLESESHDEHDIAEGVERDGMIWGMKVEEYRALSARERKRVRNRISARTFRAKRKEHLSSLETDLEVKDNQIKAARDEASRLRQEVAALKKRLAQYEQ